MRSGIDQIDFISDQCMVELEGLNFLAIGEET